MISFFTNHSQNIPIGSLTIQELHMQLVNPDREPFIKTINMIHRLREETVEKEQKKIKDELLAFTPGAQVDTKKATATPEQKNIRYSGFMQIDIDLQDNPNMTSAAGIRNKLAEIPYVALSAISARGKGVWGLIALAEPEKFTQYYEQVAYYFMGARVTIDKSKSKNPTELRYFSPDSGAILKTDYKLFPLVQMQAKQSPKQNTTKINYTGNILKDSQSWVNKTTGFNLFDGQKHYYLFWLAYSLRKSGIDEADVYQTIYNNVLSAECIKSNCISGGIAYANQKGIYTSQQAKSAPQAARNKPQMIISQNEEAQISIPRESEQINPDIWDNEIAKLEKYFNGLKLPVDPIELNPYTTINNVNDFIESTLSIIKAQNGKQTYLPYLKRLQELKLYLN